MKGCKLCRMEVARVAERMVSDVCETWRMKCQIGDSQLLKNPVDAAWMKYW